MTDMFLQRRFRADIFIRGRRPGRQNALADIPVALGMAADRLDTTVNTSFGEATLKAEHQATLGRALADGPRTIGELAALPGLGDLSLAEIGLMLIESNAALDRKITEVGKEVVREIDHDNRAALANLMLRRDAP